MENTTTMPVGLGITAAQMRQYKREYARTNPHNILGMRRYRPRIVKSEFICSTRAQA